MFHIASKFSIPQTKYKHFLTQLKYTSFFRSKHFIYFLKPVLNNLKINYKDLDLLTLTYVENFHVSGFKLVGTLAVAETC